MMRTHVSRASGRDKEQRNDREESEAERASHGFRAPNYRIPEPEIMPRAFVADYRSAPPPQNTTPSDASIGAKLASAPEPRSNSQSCD